MRIYIFLAFGLWASVGFAKPDATARVSAGVAEIYIKPTFDSRVVDRLKKGTVLTVKPDKIVGTGGLGVFYKIKRPNGKAGYITDSDMQFFKPAPIVKVAPQVPETPAAPEVQDVEDVQKVLEAPEEPVAPVAPVTKAAPIAKVAPVAAPPAPAKPVEKVVNKPGWLGFEFSSVDYSEKLPDRKWGQTQFFYGARWTGPAIILGDLRPDATIEFTPGAPNFLTEAGAYGKTSGFLFRGDFLLRAPLFAGKFFSTHLGLGPMWNYANYSTNYLGNPYSVNQWHFGGDLDAGFIFHKDKWAIGVDLKYSMESTMYLSENFSLLFPL